MSEIIFIFIIMAIIAMICGVKKRYLFSPWVLTLGIWTISLLAYSYQDLLNTSLTWHFYLPFIIWISCLCFSSKMTYSLTSNSNCSSNQTAVSNFRLNILIVFLIITLPLYIYRYISELIAYGVSWDIIFNLRENATHYDESLGIAKIVPSVAKALLIIEMYLFPKKGYREPIFIILINLIIGLVLMEKGSILFIAIIVIYFLLKKKLIKLKSVFIFCFILIGFLFFLNLLRSGFESQSSFFDFIALYVASPPVAFEYINPESTQLWGGYTFRFFYALFKPLGFNVSVLPNQMDAVYLPYYANVYTILQPYYQDFGIIGVIIFGILIGTILGYLYKKSIHSNNIIIQGIYAYLITITINQYFQDQFMLSLSVILQLLIIFIFISKTSTNGINSSSFVNIQWSKIPARTNK